MAGTPTLDTETIKLVDRKGRERTYVLSTIPATYSREIVAQWFMGILPVTGGYKLNEEMMFKLLSYVGVPSANGAVITWLKTRELIDNHTDFKTLELLEREMARFNWGFFLHDDLSNLSALLVRTIKEWITRTMTGSSPASSEPAKPPSTNSAQSTH